MTKMASGLQRSIFFRQNSGILITKKPLDVGFFIITSTNSVALEKTLNTLTRPAFFTAHLRKSAFPTCAGCESRKHPVSYILQLFSVKQARLNGHAHQKHVLFQANSW